MDFQKADVVVLVGVAMVVMALWLQVAAVVIYGIVSRRLSMGWLLVLGWMIICVLYLSLCPSGYLHDLAEIVKRH